MYYSKTKDFTYDYKKVSIMHSFIGTAEEVGSCYLQGLGIGFRVWVDTSWAPPPQFSGVCRIRRQEHNSTHCVQYTSRRNSFGVMDPIDKALHIMACDSEETMREWIGERARVRQGGLVRIITGS